MNCFASGYKLISRQSSFESEGFCIWPWFRSYLASIHKIIVNKLPISALEPCLKDGRPFYHFLLPACGDRIAEPYSLGNLSELKFNRFDQKFSTRMLKKIHFKTKNTSSNYYTTMSSSHSDKAVNL